MTVAARIIPYHWARRLGGAVRLSLLPDALLEAAASDFTRAAALGQPKVLHYPWEGALHFVVLVVLVVLVPGSTGEGRQRHGAEASALEAAEAAEERDRAGSGAGGRRRNNGERNDGNSDDSDEDDDEEDEALSPNDNDDDDDEEASAPTMTRSVAGAEPSDRVPERRGDPFDVRLRFEGGGRWERPHLVVI